MASHVASVLAEYGALTRKALDDCISRSVQEPFLRSLLADYPGRGGKMLRPSLCIATARAFGAATEDAVSSAVAIELLHNGMLIHDDIEDGSELRRGAPALHVLHGVPIAVNAGDMLLLMSLRPLMTNIPRLGAKLALAIFNETERTAWEVARGQALELEWCRQNKLALRDGDYLDMVFKKTSWLGMVYPTRIGALIGSRGRADLSRFVRFGFFLGAAFQIQDDILNLVGDEVSYGKERDGDLYEGKRTLILLHSWRQSSSGERRELERVLDIPRYGKGTGDVAWVRDLIERNESISYARAIAHALAGAALYEFDRAFQDVPDSPDKAFIRDLAAWVFDRS